jgi:hypothetical protein
MSNPEHARPVWVSEEHAEYIDRYLGGFKARWDAAPADSEFAVRKAISTALRMGTSTTDATLRALGSPDA